jgi:hypothetical protein
MLRPLDSLFSAAEAVSAAESDNCLLELLAEVIETARFCGVVGGCTDRRDQAAVGCQQGRGHAKCVCERDAAVKASRRERISGGSARNCRTSPACSGPARSRRRYISSSGTLASRVWFLYQLIEANLRAVQRLGQRRAGRLLRPRRRVPLRPGGYVATGQSRADHAPGGIAGPRCPALRGRRASSPRARQLSTVVITAARRSCLGRRRGAGTQRRPRPADRVWLAARPPQ